MFLNDLNNDIIFLSCIYKNINDYLKLLLSNNFSKYDIDRFHEYDLEGLLDDINNFYEELTHLSVNIQDINDDLYNIKDTINHYDNLFNHIYDSYSTLNTLSNDIF